MRTHLGMLPAVNRLLPYRGLHTDLVAAEQYYIFNDPTVPALDAWTQGSNADLVFSDTSSSEYFDGANAFEFYPVATATNDVNVYVQASVSNIDSAIPCTFRVIARSEDANRWLRIYDPGDANSDVWVDLFNEVLGTVGTGVLEALLTNPPPGTTAGGNGLDAGEANGFVQVELELPAAASRTIRIQLVDGDGEVNFSGSTADNLCWIARADVRNGKVSQWRCRHTGRTFSQATAANQPYARPMGVPQFNGRRVLRFSNLQCLVSDDTSTEWAFLNSGAECSVYTAALLTVDNSGYVLSSHGAGPTTDGWSFSIDPVLDEWAIQAFNAATATIINIRTPASLNTLYVLGYRGLDGHADGDVVADIGGSEYVANASNWSAGIPPTHTLHIGARPPAVNVPFDGYIADIAIYSARLEDDEHARAVEELEALNATSASIAGCVLAVQADAGVSEDPTGTFDWLWDSRVAGVVMTPVGTVLRPEASNGMRGSMAARLTTPQRFENTDSLVPDLNADHAVIACIQVLADTTADDVLWEVRNPTSVNTYERLAYAAGQWVFTRRSHVGATDTVSVGTANLLPHVHSFVHAGGQRSAWVDGTSLFSGVASSPGTMTGATNTQIGRGHLTDDGTTLLVSEFALYSAAPNTYQRQLVERAQRRRMLGGGPLIKGHSLGRVSQPVSLLRLVTDAGGFLFDFRTPDGYTLGSGTDVAAITELITNTSIADASTTPPVLLAGGMDGRDCIDFAGTTNRYYSGVVAGLIAAAQSDSEITVIARCRCDLIDVSSAVLGFADTGGNAIRVFGQSATGAGALRYRTVSDAGAAAVAFTDPPPDNTDPHTWRWEIADAGVNVGVSAFMDGTPDASNPTVLSKSGSALLDTVTVGGEIGNTNRFDGRISLIVVLPGTPDFATIQAIEAAIEAGL